MTKKKNFLSDEDMDPKNIRANITIRIAGEVLDSYRKWAEQLGVGYQTLMKLKLAEALKQKSIEDRVSHLEAVFKKAE